MRNLFVLVVLVSGLIFLPCCEEEGSGVTISAQYAAAGDYDDGLVALGQAMTAQIESENVVARAAYFPPDDFGSSHAGLNAAENWVEATYTFIPEDIDAFEGPADAANVTINGTIMTKMKTKESVEEAFGIEIDLPQGICADVQKHIYDTVYNDILTSDQRSRYESEGKSLRFIEDNAEPPLTNDTNPMQVGSAWKAVDPSTQFTNDGDDYFYEPMSCWVDRSDPDVTDDMEGFLVGVRYCTWLSHQAILNWMLDESFEDAPALLTPWETEGACTEPSSFDSEVGSCIFHFTIVDTYYCADFTGPSFTVADAQERCASSFYNQAEYVAKYSSDPCSARTAELASEIPGYVEFGGVCVINCQADDEFLWNIYQDNPADRCTSPYTFILP